MRGTILKRGTRYSVVVELDRDPLTGRRRREWHSGFKTRKEAEDARISILADIQRGEHVEPSRLTVRDFLEDEWLPAMRPNLRPSTYESYELNVRRVTERIGERRLQSLTPATLNRLYSALRERLAPRTVRYTHTVLRQALADAVAWQWIPRNPADRARPPAATTDELPPRTWSARELERFLAHIADDRLAAAWRVLAMTGIRRGELLGLSWRAVDFDGGRLAVTRTLVSGKGSPRFSEPKTKRGRRSVALDPSTVDALRAHRERQLVERLDWGPAYHAEHDLVFCREDGTPIWPRTLSRWFDQHVRDAGLPKIRLHDLRHTHATLALQAGVHSKVVQERLGHATIAITLDTYSHAIPAMQEDAAARVAALIAN